MGPERVFNIGSGSGRSLNQIVTDIETVLCKKQAITRLEHRQVDVPKNTLNIAHARSTLHWTPKTEFMTGLSKTASWMQQIKCGEQKQTHLT